MGELALIGTLASMAGSIYGGMASANAASYQAAIAAHQAEISNQNAQISRETTAEEQKRQSWQNQQRMGSIKAGIAAGGVDVGSGSAAQVTESQDILGQDLAAQTERVGQQKWWGFKNEADMHMAQSKLDQMQANNDRFGSFISAFGSGIKGLGNYNMNYGGF